MRARKRPLPDRAERADVIDGKAAGLNQTVLSEPAGRWADAGQLARSWPIRPRIIRPLVMVYGSAASDTGRCRCLPAVQHLPFRKGLSVCGFGNSQTQERRTDDGESKCRGP